MAEQVGFMSFYAEGWQWLIAVGQRLALLHRRRRGRKEWERVGRVADIVGPTSFLAPTVTIRIAGLRWRILRLRVESPVKRWE